MAVSDGAGGCVGGGGPMAVSDGAGGCVGGGGPMAVSGGAGGCVGGGGPLRGSRRAVRGSQLRARPAGARSGETCRAGTILERGLLRRWWLGVGWFCLTRAKPK